MKLNFSLILIVNLCLYVITIQEATIVNKESNEVKHDNPPEWIPTNDEINDMVEKYPDATNETDKSKSESKNDKVDIKVGLSNKNKKETDLPNDEPDKEEIGLDDFNDLSHLTNEEIERRLKEEEIEYGKKLIISMGINNMKVIPKDVFKEYMTKMILTIDEEEDPEGEEQQDPEEEEFLNLLLEEIMKEIPDEFPREKFEEYADTDRYKHLVDKILKSKFGDNYSENIVKMMQGSVDNEKESMPNKEELDEMMHEFEKQKNKPNNSEAEDLDMTKNLNEQEKREIRENMKKVGIDESEIEKTLGKENLKDDL